MNDGVWIIAFFCVLYNLPAFSTIIAASVLMKRPVSIRRFDRYHRRDNTTGTLKKIAHIRRTASWSLLVLPVLILTVHYVHPNTRFQDAATRYISLIIFLGLFIGNLALQILHNSDLRYYEDRLRPFILKD